MFSRLRRLFGRANGECGEARGMQKEADLRSWYRRTRNKWFPGRHSSIEKASSQCSRINEQQLTKLDKMIIQLKTMTCERDELRGILANYADKDLNIRFLFEFILLNLEHRQVMTNMNKLAQELREASDKYKVLTKETESYRLRHCELMLECTKLMLYINTLRNKNRKLQREHFVLYYSCEKTKGLCEEVIEKICGLCAKKQQELEVLEERLQDILKQEKLATQERDLAENMEHHTDVIEMRSDILQSDMEGATAQKESFLQTELLQQNN